MTRHLLRLFLITVRWNVAVSSVPLERPNSAVRPAPVIKQRSKCNLLTNSLARLSTNEPHLTTGDIYVDVIETSEFLADIN